MSKRTRENLVAYLFIAPFLLVFLIFLAYPIAYSAWISLHKTTIFTSWLEPFDDMKWCGLQNYTQQLSDPNLWWSLLFTLIYGILTIPTGIFFSLFLATLLNNKLRGSSFFRSAFFLPNVLDVFVIGITWLLIFDPNYGLLNALLNKIGIGPLITGGLLGNPYTCLPAIALAMVLKGAGFGMVLFLTAMSNISPAVYEAANIDGANYWQKFRYITIPLVRPIILFMVITGTVTCLTAFTEVYAMTINTGGPTIQVPVPPFSLDLKTEQTKLEPTTKLGKISQIQKRSDVSLQLTHSDRSLRAANLVGYNLYMTFSEAMYGRAAALSFILLAVASIVSWINNKIIMPNKAAGKS